MKLLIISDVHSNLCALDAVLAREADADRIICAGDLVDYGPFPCDVIDRFIEREIPSVHGNHDRAVLHAYRSAVADPGKRRDPPYRWSQYNAMCMEERHAAYLESLPEDLVFEVDGCTYLVTHQYGVVTDYGTIECLHDFDAFYDARVPDKPTGERRIIFGHTHRQGVHLLAKDRLWLNPGSIAYRRPGDPGREAEYMTITDGEIRMKHLSYDRAPLLEAARHLPITEQQREWAFQHWA